jgi:hypothetical protein
MQSTDYNVQYFVQLLLTFTILLQLVLQRRSWSQNGATRFFMVSEPGRQFEAAPDPTASAPKIGMFF